MNRFFQILPVAIAMHLAYWLCSTFPIKVLPSSGSDFQSAAAERRSVEDVACFDTIIATLNNNCQFVFTPAILIGGSLPSCVTADDLQIQIDDSNPSNGPIADGPGYYRYLVSLKKRVACTTFTNCWGVVKVEDKSGPTITGPADLILALSCPNLDKILKNPRSLKYTGYAFISDNCRPKRDTLKEFSDAIYYDNHCDTIIIRRAFTGKDQLGNVSSYSQFITLVRPDISKVTIKDKFNLDAGCQKNASFPLDAKGNVQPTITGYPYFQDALQDTINIAALTKCGFSASYQDIRFDICPAAYKLVRTWTVVDWCRNQRKTFVQTIKIGDVEPPTIGCPAGVDTMKISTSPFGCTAAFEVPAPLVKDACSTYDWSAEVITEKIQLVFKGGNVFDTLRTQVSLGSVNSRQARRVLAGMPVGCHRIVYSVNDACENRSTSECLICVADKISPIAKCDNTINLTLGGQGYGRLTVDDVNEGSTDNCGIDSIQIRRYVEVDSITCTPLKKPRYSSWLPVLYFTCCDVGKKIKIELKVIDKSGNSNICWTEVLVEDKLAPWIEDLPETEIYCDSLPTDFNPSDSLALRKYFGLPNFGDNCSATLIEYKPEVKLSRCGAGYIRRRFTVRDASGNFAVKTATQLIRVILRHNYTIKFPKDYIEYCKDPTADTVALDEIGCDILALNISDKRYEGSGSSCYTIHRTFQVINWCEYEEGAKPVIIPRDADCNKVGGDKDIWVLLRRNGVTYLDADNDERNKFPIAGTKGTSCDGKTNPAGYWLDSNVDPYYRSTGIWQYTQIIQVVDQQAPEIFVEDNLTFCTDAGSCNGNVFFSVGIRDNCSSEPKFSTDFKYSITKDSSYLENPWRIVGRYPKYIFTGIFAEGDYEVEVTVSDNCGNKARASVKFKVVDCKAPSITCINGLAIELSKLPPKTDADGDGDIDIAAGTIWASDFVQNVAETCSQPVRLSINRVGEKPDINRTSLIVTCDDFGTLPIEIYAWDSANNPRSRQPNGKLGGPNYDYCRTYLLVQDNLYGLCSKGTDTLKIAGDIETFRERKIPGVLVKVGNAREANNYTDQNGRYVVSQLTKGYDYSLVPQKADAQLNGVTTFDLIMISQHILGVRPFTSPYQFIAADINQSRSITTLDIILLRRAILNIDTLLNKDGVSWVFVNKNYSFPNLNNPLATFAPQAANFNNLPSTQTSVNFVGIKLGDLNDNALIEPNRSVTPRASLAAWQVYLPEKIHVEGDQKLSIPVRIDQDQTLQGCQFALQLTYQGGLDIEDLLFDGLLDKSQVSLQKDPTTGETLIRVSWNKAPEQRASVDKQDLLFTILAHANTDKLPSLNWRLNERLMPSEAYFKESTDLTMAPLRLSLAKDQVGTHLPYFYSVTPNPFNQQALLRWFVPIAGDGELRIINGLGQILMTKRQFMDAGENQLELTGELFPASGMYRAILHLDGAVINIPFVVSK
jgi:hypothetical protein